MDLEITLLALNARYTHTNLALLYMRNAIEAVDKGHHTRLLECVVTDRRADILERLLGVESGHRQASQGSTKIDVVVLSAYIWNSALIRQLVPDIRMLLPNACIVVGGPEVSYDADEWLQSLPGLDLVVCGPGEAAIQELAAAGFPRSGLPGAERIILRPNPHFRDIPFPYRDEDLQKLSRRYVYYESSRGCPCSCSYCVSGRDDQRTEFKDLEQVKHEVTSLLAHESDWDGPPIVKFVDRSFNADPARAHELWRFLGGLETEAVFHCEVQPAFLRDHDLLVLAGVPKGRLQFEIGIQTVVNETLGAIGRAAGGWHEMREIISRVIALETIEVHLDMIVGLPGEDIVCIGRTVDEVLALAPERFDIGFLKSLPGTRVRSEAQQHNQISMQEAPYQVVSNAYLGVEEFARMRRVQELVEAVWNHNKISRPSFETLCRMSNYAWDIGYDIRTRRRDKVEAFLASFECSGYRDSDG